MFLKHLLEVSWEALNKIVGTLVGAARKPKILHQATGAPSSSEDEEEEPGVYASSPGSNPGSNPSRDLMITSLEAL